MKLNRDDIFILNQVKDHNVIKRHEIKQRLVNDFYNHTITDKRANRIIVRSAGKLAQSGCIKIMPDFQEDEDGYIDVRRNIYKITNKGIDVSYIIDDKTEYFLR